MLAAGEATVVRPTGVGRHLCWAFTDRAGFLDRARAFLAEGRAAGEQRRLVGADLTGLDRFPALPVFDPAAAMAAALAAGFTGLRVVVDATPLVRSPSSRADFAAYEHLVDRSAADHPFSAVVVDGAALEFIDHRSLLRLADHARGRGATAVLRTALPAAARLADLRRVPGVRVEAR